MENQFQGIGPALPWRCGPCTKDRPSLLAMLRGDRCVLACLVLRVMCTKKRMKKVLRPQSGSHGAPRRILVAREARNSFILLAREARNSLILAASETNDGAQEVPS